MAWVSWKKLCIPKERGGTGFRDLKDFNLALLAKKGWRILKNQSSLIHRVFKAKYFAQCSFWEAQVGRRPSYAWRSIMAAREVSGRLEMENKLVFGKTSGSHPRVHSNLQVQDPPILILSWWLASLIRKEEGGMLPK